MSLWSWTRHVVTDQTGGVEPVPVSIERVSGSAPELGAKGPPDVPLFVLRVGLRSGFGGTLSGLPGPRRGARGPGAPPLGPAPGPPRRAHPLPRRRGALAPHGRGNLARGTRGRPPHPPRRARHGARAAAAGAKRRHATVGARP